MSQRTSSVDLKFKKRVHATFDAKCISSDAGVLPNSPFTEAVRVP